MTTDTEIQMAGATADPIGAQLAAFYAGRLTGHVSFDTLADLGYGTAYDDLRILLDDPAATRDDIRAAVASRG